MPEAKSPLLDGKVVRSDADRDEEAGIKKDGRAAAEVIAADKQAAAGACISITMIAVLVVVPMLSAFLISTATQGWWTFGKSAGSGALAILGSELGDKTFFIAVILSMTQPQLSVWSGAVSALSIMTVGASALGSAVPLFLPLKVTHLLAIVLFAGFGLKMLWDSRSANDGVSSKLGQAADAKEKSGSSANADVWRTASQIVLQAFTLTFFSEWGDRSQVNKPNGIKPP